MSSVFGEQQVETQAIKPVEFEPPKCLDFFNKWRFCLYCSSVATVFKHKKLGLSSKLINNQFHQYYIHGKFKDCTPYRKAMTSCMLYKSTKSQKAKECMIEVLKMDEIKFTSSSVWEKRENPADEWNK